VTASDTDAGATPRAHRGGDRDLGELLRRAEQVIEVGYGRDDRFAVALRHMIRSAADMAAALPTTDPAAAREVLGHARAALGAAVYAVRALHDEPRTG
jgi:regulator of sirC expression with transglutaminase-like and TPR domain